jgi:hypothetical protein
MAQKAVRKIGQYRLYKVEGYGIYEIYYGTKGNWCSGRKHLLTRKTLNGLLAKSKEVSNKQ